MCSELQKSKDLYEKSLRRLSTIREQIPRLETECETLQPTIQHKKLQVEQLENEAEAEKEIETEVSEYSQVFEKRMRRGRNVYTCGFWQAEILTNGARTVLNNCEKRLNLRKQEYEKKLAEVHAIWENVREILQSLTSADITLLKTVKNPPKPLKLVIEALAFVKVRWVGVVARRDIAIVSLIRLFGFLQEIKPEKIQESGKLTEDVWKPTMKFIGDAKFVDALIAFDKSNVSARAIRLLEEKIFSNDDFDMDKVKSCSLAAEGKARARARNTWAAPAFSHFKEANLAQVFTNG